MRQIAFFYAGLPKRSLSSNSRVRHLHASDDVLELRSGATNELLKYGAVLGLKEPFARARIHVTWHLTNRKPKIEECPRCLLWILEHPRSNEKQCLCYRPTDPLNAASALKAFVDGVTDAGVWPDDSWDYIELGRIARRRVTSLEDEGLYVEIEELEPAP